jgi:tetrapyrrole methylase family protein/MazG family protein
VFGKVKADNGDQSLVFWENIKREENRHETTYDAMNSVARSLPALWRAEKIQKKAAKVGFDWPEYTGALDKLHSELAELERAIKDNDETLDGSSVSIQNNIEEELGDLLFSVVNLARFFDIDPERALTKSSDKFISRFGELERITQSNSRQLENMTLDEMESIYQKVKENELEEH